MPPRPLYALRGAKSQIQLHIVGIFNADVGQIAEMAHVIKAVTYYEFVWYNKAHIVRRNGTFAPFGLIQQAGYPKACGLAGFNMFVRWLRVRPLSIISSTISTWRPVIERSMSFEMRTMPEVRVPLP